MSSSGMAGKIRSCRDDDEFDLGGYSRQKCFDLVKEAFTEPLELPKMIKLTFVAGAGKLSRQKYGDDLVKDFCQALDSIGFDTDQGAVADMSACAKYKYQHDTGKNLKFVHVFPRVVAPAAEEGEEEEGEDGAPAQGGQRAPEDVLVVCELDDFRRMVSTHVVSYSTKKRLLDIIRERLARLDEAEQKLIAREVLDSDLQKLYDTLDANGLKEKMKVMATEMQASIDNAELTSDERTQVLEQLDDKLSALQEQLSKAEAEGKAKTQAKLEEAKAKLLATKVAVSDAKPAPMVPIKYATDLQRLHKRLTGLTRLEKENSGKFTLDQLKALGERPEMEEAKAEMMRRSRMWFESDKEFDARLKHCLSQAPPPAKKAAGGSSGYPAANKSDGFQTVKRR